MDALVKYNEIEAAKEEGKSLGIEEGIQSRNIQIAKNLLKENIDIQIISKTTDLTIKDIKELQSTNDE